MIIDGLRRVLKNGRKTTTNNNNKTANKPGVMYLNRKKNAHNIHTHIKGVTIRKKQR